MINLNSCSGVIKRSRILRAFLLKKTLCLVYSVQVILHIHKITLQHTLKQHNQLVTMWHTGNIYFITAIAVIGGGLFGFDISSMSAIISTDAYLCYFNQGPDGPGFNDKPNCSGPRSGTQGGITASMAAGSWVGALTSGKLSDKWGRKTAIQIGSVFWCVLYIIQSILPIANLIQGHWLHHCLCSSEHPHAYSWSNHQRCGSWYLLSPSTCLYF